MKMNINDLLTKSHNEMMKVVIKKKVNGEITLDQFNKILGYWERNHKKEPPHIE